MSDNLKTELIFETFTKHLKETNSPWLDSDVASAWLSCSPGTLRTWRSLGTGPRYHVMHGKLIRYHIDDLNAFVYGEANR